MILLLLLRGGEGASVAGVKCGSWLYWLLVCIIVPYLLGFVYYVSRNLKWQFERKSKAGFTYLKDDLVWNRRTIMLFLLFSIGIGIIAGFLGVGGGLLSGPILMEMGLLPQVSAAASSFMILYTSSSTTAQFIILNKLLLWQGIWFFCVGLIAALAGQFGVATIVSKYKKQAFVALLLAGAIGMASVLMLIFQFMNIAKDVKNHIPIQFHSICQSGS